MSLFALGPFKLPSGRTTHFKIECDDLTDDDWAALARLAVEILPPFAEVQGVPRGGIPFADALREYATPSGELLIADDVWVSGKSYEEFRDGREAIGIIAFTRTPIQSPWVKALFAINPIAEEATYQLNRPANHVPS